MSVSVMTAVWAIDLPASQKIVLLALADAANDDGHCWPGMASLSRKCSKSERTVQAMLAELEAAGHLSRVQNPGKGCNYYVHPRNSRTPAETAPPQKTAKTPAKSAPKPPRTIKSKQTEARAHILPADWKPAEFGLGTKSRSMVDGWPPGELAVQLEHFTAHHGGKGNRFVDWQAAWSTWVLNGRRYGNARTTKHSPANDEPVNPYARAVIARQADRASAVG